MADGDLSDADLNKMLQARQRSYRRGGVSAPVERESMPTDFHSWKPPHHEKTPHQMAMLNEILDKNLLFRYLDDEEKDTLRSAMFHEHVELGHTVIQQGDPGDNFYVLIEGECDVFKSFSPGQEAVKVHHYNVGGTFGELALMYDTPRAASVIASTDAEFLAMDRLTYKNVIYTSTMKKRERYEHFLSLVPLLSPLSVDQRKLLTDALQPCKFAKDEIIIEEGDTNAETFYIVERGTCVCTKKREDGTDEEVLRCSEGDYFGEIALLKDAPRAATVVAITDDVASLVCDRASFTRLLGPLQEILEKNIAQYKP